MKKGIYLLTAVFLLSAVPVFANCGVCPLSKDGDWVTKKVEKMTADLGLTAEQATDLKNALEDKKAAKTEAKSDYKEELDSILTPEQKVKYEAMKAEKKGSDHEHKGSGHEKKGSDGEKKGSDAEMKSSDSEKKGS